MIHSYETFADIDITEEKCPKCKNYYGNYVMDLKGNRICASCYKGKLAPMKKAIEEKTTYRRTNFIQCKKRKTQCHVEICLVISTCPRHST